MEFVVRLFPEARARQRRRHLVSTCLLLAATLIALALLRPSPPAPLPIAAPPGTPVLAADAVFARDPYMGVRCPVANSIACDRVGLAVWLKRPALAVTATIDGRALVMRRDGDRLAAPGHPRTAFDGYLQPAGIRANLGAAPAPGSDVWTGDPTPYATVWLLIQYANGHRALTHTKVPLMAGWG